MLHCYVSRKFNKATRRVIAAANVIIETYQDQGYDLTLRQLYYQFVSRDLLPNLTREYHRLGSIISNARLAGLVDWEAITDRTRVLRTLAHWDDPAEIVAGAASQYRIDRWATQPNRLEVWIEKDALVGVFERECQKWDVPLLSCRGYTSQSEMWGAAQRLLAYVQGGQKIVILHFGDHDPSGLDMTRDIEERLTLFEVPLAVHRLALNMDQVKQYKPPPNPAKDTDSRFAGYIRRFGTKSWELDALEPTVLGKLVERAIMDVLDASAWQAADRKEARQRRVLTAVSRRWEEVERFLRKKH